MSSREGGRFIANDYFSKGFSISVDARAYAYTLCRSINSSSDFSFSIFRRSYGVAFLLYDIYLDYFYRRRSIISFRNVACVNIARWEEGCVDCPLLACVSNFTLVCVCLLLKVCRRMVYLIFSFTRSFPSQFVIFQSECLYFLEIHVTNRCSQSRGRGRWGCRFRDV